MCFLFLKMFQERHYMPKTCLWVISAWLSCPVCFDSGQPPLLTHYIAKQLILSPETGCHLLSTGEWNKQCWLTRFIMAHKLPPPSLWWYKMRGMNSVSIYCYCGNLLLLFEKQRHFFQNHSREFLNQALQKPSEIFTQQSHISAPWIWQNECCETRLLLHAMHAKIDMKKASFQCIACS